MKNIKTDYKSNLIIKYDLIGSYFKSIKQHRRGRRIWIKSIIKEIYNIAQNKSIREFKSMKKQNDIAQNQSN